MSKGVKKIKQNRLRQCDRAIDGLKATFHTCGVAEPASVTDLLADWVGRA